MRRPRRRSPLDPLDARTKLLWWKPENYPLAIDFVDGLEDLCQKNRCTLTDLAVAFLLAQGDYINVICGAHKPEENTRGRTCHICGRWAADWSPQTPAPEHYISAGECLTDPAVAFLLAQGDYINVICGAHKPEQIEADIRAAGVTLSEADVLEIRRRVEELEKQMRANSSGQ